MEENAEQEIVNNTEQILENTSEIRKTGIKVYNQERQKRVWEALLYTNQRTDTLLITISGAGIYACLETFKFYSEKGIAPHYTIKLAAILLLLAIILNFISQKISAKVHSYDYSKLDVNLTCEEEDIDKAEFQDKLDKYEKLAGRWDKVNQWTSSISILFMSLGLGGIVIFFIAIF